LSTRATPAARREDWWRRRSPDPIPATADEAVDLANSGALASTHKITVRAVAGEPYERIVDYELGPMPEPLPAAAAFDPDEVPF
jgi:DNA repair protein RadD